MMTSRRKNVLLTICLFFSGGIAPALSEGLSETAQVELDYVHDFEGGVMTLNTSGNAPEASTEEARNGDWSMKSVLTNSSPNKKRTEGLLPGSKKDKQLLYGRDYWYGFSSKLPADWKVPGKFELLAQFHGVADRPGDKGGVPLSIQMGRGTWMVRNQSVAGTRDWYGSPITPDLGRWVDWVIHFRPSLDTDGLLEVWKGGELIAERKGPNTTAKKLGPYFKMGYYHGPFKIGKKVIYHDELRVASGPEARYEDVDPANYE
ncbi:MAG: polysaccharide lyase [Halioglobus sp.]